MKTLTIELTDAEYHALATEAKDVHHFVENFARYRARLAIDKHYKDIVKRSLETGEAISGSKEEIFLNAGIPALADFKVKDNDPSQKGN